jgi:hypothetical protein
MGREFPAPVAGGCMAADSGLAHLAVRFLNTLGRLVGHRLSRAIHRDFPLSAFVRHPPTLVALLPPIETGRAHEGLFAGYWNSQSPVWLRRHLGYSQLVAWQERLYDCAQWVWVGLLLPLAVETCACGLGAGWFRRAARVYVHWFYWITVLVAGFVATWVTWTLADWAPPAGLAGQTFSIVARLGVAYSVDIFLWCFLLALVGYYFE